MKRLIYLFLLLGFAVSCSTDLNVLADYKETAIVYGLLNQSDTAQYIKINKAFLGPGNALQMAQVFDSVNYANQLTVQLEQWKNGNKLSTITLSKDSSIAKPAGIFSYPKQILYKTKAALDEASQYNLVITNNATHNIITGSTLLVNDFAINKPYTGSTIVDFSSTVQNFKIEWVSANNGKIYGVTMRFHYLEEDKATSVVTPKYLDWVYGNQTSNVGGEIMKIEFFGEDFYQYLQNHIPVDNNVKRYLPNTGSHIDLIFSVGSPDLNTYLLVSQPSTGIIQEKPQYSNLKNGFGLFSSRYVKIHTGWQLNLFSRDLLYGGTFTKNIFCDPNPLSPNHCF